MQNNCKEIISGHEWWCNTDIDSRTYKTGTWTVRNRKSPFQGFPLPGFPTVEEALALSMPAAVPNKRKRKPSKPKPRKKQKQKQNSAKKKKESWKTVVSIKGGSSSYGETPKIETE